MSSFLTRQTTMRYYIPDRLSSALFLQGHRFLHTDTPMLADQQKCTFISNLRTLGVVKRTHLQWLPIGTDYREFTWESKLCTCLDDNETTPNTLLYTHRLVRNCFLCLSKSYGRCQSKEFPPWFELVWCSVNAYLVGTYSNRMNLIKAKHTPCYLMPNKELSFVGQINIISISRF